MILRSFYKKIIFKIFEKKLLNRLNLVPETNLKVKN